MSTETLEAARVAAKRFVSAPAVELENLIDAIRAHRTAERDNPTPAPAEDPTEPAEASGDA